MTSISENPGRTLSEHDLLVLKTDLQGTMTYANRNFIKFSGYSEDELIGQPHKILRHQDMPRAIFRLMWETLEADREFFAYLKYLRKDGGYFWTFANLAPSLDDNNKVNGSFSIQRKAHPTRLRFFANLYQEMLEAERLFDTDQAQMDASTEVLNKAMGGRGYDEFIITT